MSGTMSMMTLAITVQESLADEKFIESDRFTNFAFTFFVKEVFFDDIVAGGIGSGAKVATEICGLTVLTVGVDEVLKEEAEFT